MGVSRLISYDVFFLGKKQKKNTQSQDYNKPDFGSSACEKVPREVSRYSYMLSR